MASLNGDIDNFQGLYQKYVIEAGAAVDPGITTDAKIIPVVVEAKLRETERLEQAFERAFAEFEGADTEGSQTSEGYRGIQ